MTQVALAQIASPDDETQRERIERVRTLLLDNRGANLYALPELWSSGYFNFAEYPDLAESLTGPTVSMARRVARELSAHIHIGSIIERDDSGKLFNTAVLVNPSGEIAQIYRKIHVFGYESLEADLLTPGDTLSVVKTPFGQVASTTCYDLRFPGLWQELSTRGAETVLVPAAWPAARREHWQVLTQARAIEHQCWIIACNAVGQQGATELAGASRIVSPSGQIIAECSNTREQVAVVELDSSAVEATRNEFPVIQDRLVSYVDLDPNSGATH